MSKKEIKLHMGFMDENGNLVEIPENIQKHIEVREEFWANKIKDIDSKCGIVLERLALTEKALELAVSQLDDAKDMLRECGKRDWAGMLDTSVDYFKARAKEMGNE
jgi:hypothetical protein